jgi:hypothetical protein
MTLITRVFDNPGRAQAALDELQAHQFANAEVVEAPEGRGKTMLRVDAPFGTGVRVEEILKRHANGGVPAAAAPKSVAAPAARPAAKPAAAAAPPPPGATAQPPSRSAAMSPGPERAASDRGGAHDGVKSGPRTLSSLLGIPELIDSDTFFSGFPLLIRPKPRRDTSSAVKPN